MRRDFRVILDDSQVHALEHWRCYYGFGSVPVGIVLQHVVEDACKHHPVIPIVDMEDSELVDRYSRIDGWDGTL